MTIRCRLFWLLLALTLLGLSPVRGGEFYSNGGLPGVETRLHRAQSGVRILHVGAHPDDEDSALLAWLSLGQGARVTYLSLTRGEGGQNLIGDEFGTHLGILRTEELLAARRFDRAGQLFGRMIDFGFSKTPEECFRIWGREEVTRDIVRAIRLTRPHIVICQFQGNSEDGHGHHQAVGMATRDAVEASADPERFPEQLSDGLTAWKVQAFYTRARPGSEEITFRIDTGEYNPWTGHSYAATGYKGRSQHRSQDMGMIEYEFLRPSLLVRADGQDAKAGRLFESIDLPPRPFASQLNPLVENHHVMPDVPSPADTLVRILSHPNYTEGMENQVRTDLEYALSNLRGIRIEALADRESLCPGQQVAVTCRLFSASESGAEAIEWQLTGNGDLEVQMTDSDGVRGGATFQVTASPNAAVSVPYFLRRQPDGWLYRWPEDSPGSLPFERPAVTATCQMELAGIPIRLQTPVQYRWADPAYGERQSDLAIVPRISVRFDPARLVLREGRTDPGASPVVSIQNRGLGGARGRLLIASTQDSPGPLQEIAVALGEGEGARIPLELSKLPESAGEYGLEAYWLGEGDDAAPAHQVHRLDYRHIHPRLYCQKSRMELHRIDVSVPENLRVGYVEGTGDEVDRILRQLGIEVVSLGAEDLLKGDLSGFDAILTGIRAYEVRRDLASANGRLFDYVRSGGTLVVQYNKYPFAENQLAPFPVAMNRPHDRVTDESADVLVLEPQNPVFHYPNAIGPDDFEGWIQERGLYFLSEWDDRYTPLLASRDPGEEMKSGGLVVTRLGEGRYFYTGYSFFRQLPAGNSGACRLLVNLLSQGRERKK